jgi:GNAT superfamily N-acetyltransferase
MEMVPLDPGKANRDVLEQVDQLGSICHAEVNQLEPYRSFQETAAFLRLPPAAEPRWHWLALAGREVAEFAQLAARKRSFVGNITILARPQSRRLGVGRALFDVIALRASKEAGRGVIAHHATAAGAAFVARLGAVDTRRDIRSVLSLTDADLEVDPVPGYTLETWSDSDTRRAHRVVRGSPPRDQRRTSRERRRMARLGRLGDSRPRTGPQAARTANPSHRRS